MKEYQRLWELIKLHPNHTLQAIAVKFGIKTIELSKAQHLMMKKFIKVQNEPKNRDYSQAFPETLHQ